MGLENQMNPRSGASAESPGCDQHGVELAPPSVLGQNHFNPAGAERSKAPEKTCSLWILTLLGSAQRQRVISAGLDPFSVPWNVFSADFSGAGVGPDSPPAPGSTKAAAGVSASPDYQSNIDYTTFAKVSLQG